MEPVQIKIKKLYHDMKVPVIAAEGSACWGVYSIQDVWLPTGLLISVDTGLSYD